MAVTLNANSSTGFIATSDTSSILQLQTGGTTALTVDASQNVTLANGSTIQGLTVGRGAGAVATNTAVGVGALDVNTSGTQNTSVGYASGLLNTTGDYNASFGSEALRYNTTGANNTAIGRQALTSNTTASDNTAVGYQAAFSNTTGTRNIAIGHQALYTNSTGNLNTAVGYGSLKLSTGADNTGVGYGTLNATSTGVNNSALGSNALINNTTGGNNTGIGKDALQANTTASNNTAVGYQAGYSVTTGASNTAVGYQAGYAVATGSFNVFVGQGAGLASTGANGRNTFVGMNAGSEVTTGTKNTILGRFNGNEGGLDIRTESNYIVLSDGDGNPRLQYVYTSASVGAFIVRSNTTANSTNSTLNVYNASGPDVICEAGNFTSTAISGVIRVAKIASNSRSINAAGTVNQNGADYAEYMVKSGSFTIAKGDVCGINAEGKLTNVFADAISFCVKSTDPGLVGGDSWFTEPRPKDENNNELTSDTQEYAAWFARMEAARATVDRIAFCGQVPVNVLGATSGQYIVPVNDNGAIKGEAVSNPTFEQYQTAVGKVIAIESDGRAKIIVKVA